jgi:hypothetical protein
VSGREGLLMEIWPAPKGGWGQLYQRMQFAMGLVEDGGGGI